MQVGEAHVLDQIGEQTARGDGRGPRDDRGDGQQTNVTADFALSRRRCEARTLRIGTSVATLATTSNILMRNGIDVPQVVAFLMKSRTPVTRLTIRPIATARKDPAEGGQRDVAG